MGTIGRVLLATSALGLSVLTVVLLASGPDVETHDKGIPDVRCFSALEGAPFRFPAGADYDSSLPGDEPLHEIHLPIAIHNAGIDSDGDGSPDDADAEDALTDASRGCELARSQRTAAALLVGLPATLFWALTGLIRGPERPTPTTRRTRTTATSPDGAG